MQHSVLFFIFWIHYVIVVLIANSFLCDYVLITLKNKKRKEKKGTIKSYQIWSDDSHNNFSKPYFA